jgi:hypothetical protein
MTRESLCFPHADVSENQTSQERKMEPAHFVASQALRNHRAEKPGQSEMDAFYDRHGLQLFAALSGWRVRLSASWRRFNTREDRTAGFARRANEG